MKSLWPSLVAFIIGVLFGILICCQWTSINETVKSENNHEYVLKIKVIEDD